MQLSRPSSSDFPVFRSGRRATSPVARPFGAGRSGAPSIPVSRIERRVRCRHTSPDRSGRRPGRQANAARACAARACAARACAARACAARACAARACAARACAARACAARACAARACAVERRLRWADLSPRCVGR
ncbi:Cys-every-fifth RiPP peptide CefA [Actinoplanes sp. CA-131856]